MSSAARQAAQKAGRDFYMQEVIEHWPACVTCNWIIRRNVEVPGRIGLFRACECESVLWRCSWSGDGPPWERIEVDEQ